MLTKNAIGNLINRYKAVLKKCSLINVFGSLAVAAAAVSAAILNPGDAMARKYYVIANKTFNLTNLRDIGKKAFPRRITIMLSHGGILNIHTNLQIDYYLRYTDEADSRLNNYKELMVDNRKGTIFKTARYNYNSIKILMNTTIKNFSVGDGSNGNITINKEQLYVSSSSFSSILLDGHDRHSDIEALLDFTSGNVYIDRSFSFGSGSNTLRVERGSNVTLNGSFTGPQSTKHPLDIVVKGTLTFAHPANLQNTRISNSGTIQAVNGTHTWYGMEP